MKSPSITSWGQLTDMICDSNIRGAGSIIRKDMKSCFKPSWGQVAELDEIIMKKNMKYRFT